MILVARRASCRVANAFSTRLKLFLAKMRPQNHQNVLKTHFWQIVPGVNGLNYKIKAAQHRFSSLSQGEQICLHLGIFTTNQTKAVADPDLELRGNNKIIIKQSLRRKHPSRKHVVFREVLPEKVGGRFDLLALLAFLPSVISSFFAQNKRRVLDPSV